MGIFLHDVADLYGFAAGAFAFVRRCHERIQFDGFRIGDGSCAGLTGCRRGHPTRRQRLPQINLVKAVA